MAKREPKEELNYELPTDAAARKAGCTWDAAGAVRVRHFFQTFLRHSKGEFAGLPFDLMDWQWEDIVKPLFGWKRRNGTRRFRKAYVEIPKKNGKSTISSGIALYLLVGDAEAGAEVYTAAADRAQATIVFNESANMVEASPALSQHLDVRRSQKRIISPKTKGWYQALSADVPTKEGLNIHALIFDELHVQKTRDLWDTLAYGGAARRQPLLLAITTAGIYDPESIGWEQHSYAKGVIDGTIEDWEFFAYIRGAEQDDDWQAPETWKKANPSYGVTIHEDEMAAAAKEAANAPSKLNSFLRYRLNIWTQQADRWLPLDKWDACELPNMPPIEEMAGETCYAGLDLASTGDMSAVVLLFIRGDEYWIYPYVFAPEEAFSRRERTNQAIFRNWATAGHVITTPGDVTDYQAIRQHLLWLRDDVGVEVETLAFDPWNATQFTSQLMDEDGFHCLQFRQGYASLNEPSKRFEELICNGKIRHNGHPVMRWMVNNVAIDSDPAGNIKPSKKKSTEKIDAVVSAIMALGLAMLETSGNDELIVTL